MSRSVLLSLLLLFLMTATSCKKKQDTAADASLGSFAFTAADLAVIPYPTYDTLFFKSTGGDIIMFRDKGRSVSNTRFYKYPTNPEGFKGDYYNTQEAVAGFASATSDYISFHLSFSDPFVEKAGTKFFGLTIMDHAFPNCSWAATFRFAGDSLMSLLPDSGFAYGGYVKAIHPILSIGPLVYNHVYELVAPEPTQYCPVYFARVYYNPEQGVLGFLENNGKAYFLLPHSTNPPAGAVIPGAYLPVFPTSYWTYQSGTSTTTVRTSNEWVNFQGSLITTLDGKYMKKYLQYYDYGSGENGWTPLLSETVGDQWEFDLGPSSGNPWTRVTRVMQKTVNTDGDSVIVLRSYTYHKNPLTTNSQYTWQTYKKNVGLVKESMIDTATGQVLYSKILIDHYINR